MFCSFVFLAVEYEMPNQKSFDLKSRSQKNEEFLEMVSGHEKEFSLMKQEYIGNKHFQADYSEPNRRTGA